jgi:hypothetical protein
MTTREQTKTAPPRPDGLLGNLAKLPAALRPLEQEQRWVVWKWELTTNKKTDEQKWTKVPYRPQRPDLKASTNDPKTWGSYKTALRAYQDEKADGIGYCLKDDNISIGAFDLDNCRDPKSGEISDRARKLVDAAASYTEITVSGTGLRIIGRATGNQIHRKQKHNGFELETYRGSAVRYIVITGNPLLDSADQLNDIDELMENIVAEMDAGAAKTKAKTKKSSAHPSASREGDERPDDDDDKLDRIIRQGENGEYGGDRSAAEMYVMCEMLRRGYGRKAIRAVLLDKKNGISEKAYGEADPQKYAERQIDHAIKKIDLAYDDNNNPYRTPDNIRIALLKLRVRLRYDQFASRNLIEGLPDFGPALEDAAVTRIWMMMDQRFGLRPAPDLLTDTLTDCARLNAFHPVRDYLDSLRWDGVRRLDSWLIDYGDAPETNYTRAVGALMLIAAVRRIYDPGCKFDEMVVLEGPQGSERSTMLSVLAVRPEWFSDDLPLNADSKVVIERLSGRWIVEAAELSGMRRADIEHIKAFLSRQIDRARMAYARLSIEAPRQCIIVGTTNDSNYLRDLTGNRRFWPVLTQRWRLRELKQDRDQLWAEAAEREAEGESIRLPRELWPTAAREQKARTINDPFDEVLTKYLSDKYGKIRSVDVWEIIGMPPGHRRQGDNERLGNAMRGLGWARRQQRFGHGPEWAYVRDGAETVERRDGRFWRKTICVTRERDDSVSVYYDEEEARETRRRRNWE